VYTNALILAMTLAAKPTLEVHTLGGRVRATTLAEVGAEAIRAITPLQFDVAFLGTNSVDRRLGLATPDAEEAAIKAAMIQSAAKSVLLVDHTKFAQRSLVRYAGIDEIDIVITGRELEEQHRQALADSGAEVVYA
jgi:DeoR family fructose operon transcriptional repressor